jgi:hypothetical protein
LRAAKPKEHLKFENAPPRVEVGGTFDITVVGPAGSTDNVTLRVAPSSQVCVSAYIKIAHASVTADQFLRF